MAAKIKKEVKMTVSNDADILSKYTLAIPSMGVIVLATMGTYASSPLVAANRTALMIFVGLAILGVIYAFGTYIWRLKADAKGISEHHLLKGDRTVYYDNIKCVELHKIGGTFLYYSLILKNGKAFVRVYPVMTNSIEILERLKKLGIKINEM
ncbi:MAG: hypothetical protein IKU20_04745 [Lachnospiraceae bacterium]|nr:hypothetical protein [Lachnospiraceae bacterium]